MMISLSDDYILLQVICGHTIFISVCGLKMLLATFLSGVRFVRRVWKMVLYVAHDNELLQGWSKGGEVHIISDCIIMPF